MSNVKPGPRKFGSGDVCRAARALLARAADDDDDDDEDDDDGIVSAMGTGTVC